MTPEAIRSSGELTPEALGKAGKILIDAFFLRVKTFDDFKTKTADAFPEDKRKLAFKEGRVDFYLESRFSPIQRLRVTMTDPKREDRKIGEVRPEKIIRFEIVVIGEFPETKGNSIEFEEQVGGKIVVKPNKNSYKAVNRIQGVINVLSRKANFAELKIQEEIFQQKLPM